MMCLGLKPGATGADESTELWRYPFANFFVSSMTLVKQYLHPNATTYLQSFRNASTPLRSPR